MWLISNAGAELLAQASGHVTTPEAIAAHVAEVEARGPRLLASFADGEVAEIEVVGVLTQAPNIMAALFGGGNTTYSEIAEALAMADADPRITSARLLVNSPGGQVAGLFDCLAAIEAFSKPIETVASMACSAAYAIVATAGNVSATSVASMFGSVGVLASIPVPENVVTLTSTHAPEKAPDVTTAEGKAATVRGLDAAHELFAGAIAHGRGVTTEHVNASYGRGATVFAGEAHRLGMIDNVSRPGSRAVSNHKGPIAQLANDGDASAPTETPSMMTLETLKAEHPALYSAVINIGAEAGKAEATAGERKRVADHLAMGDACGDFALAHKAIADGASFADAQAGYAAASMKRNAQASAQTDGDGAAAVLDDSAPAPAPAPGADGGTEDLQTLAADAYLARIGKAGK